MNPSRTERKRQMLLERKAVLDTQLTAANRQRDATLNWADRAPLKIQVEQIEAELDEVERELAALDEADAAINAERGKGKASPTAQNVGTGNRWAVLVGVNHYEDEYLGNLQLAVSDVTKIRDRVLRCGYENARIQLLTDEAERLPTRSDIFQALQSSADATEEDDLLLFYYAGHGEAKEGVSYLVARDGRRSAIRDTAVSLLRVEEIMREAKARAKVIILDACHSGANIGSRGPQPMSEEFIRNVYEQAEGIAVLSACKQGELSYENRELGDGVFTHYLLDALAGAADRDGKSFVTLQDVNRHVVNGVKIWAVGKGFVQTPTLLSAVVGDIILADHRITSKR